MTDHSRGWPSLPGPPAPFADGPPRIPMPLKSHPGGVPVFSQSTRPFVGTSTPPRLRASAGKSHCHPISRRGVRPSGVEAVVSATRCGVDRWGVGDRGCRALGRGTPGDDRCSLREPAGAACLNCLTLCPPSTPPRLRASAGKPLGGPPHPRRLRVFSQSACPFVNRGNRPARRASTACPFGRAPSD